MKQIEGDRAAEVLPVVSETDAQKKGSNTAAQLEVATKNGKMRGNFSQIKNRTKILTYKVRLDQSRTTNNPYILAYSDIRPEQQHKTPNICFACGLVVPRSCGSTVFRFFAALCSDICRIATAAVTRCPVSSQCTGTSAQHWRGTVCRLGELLTIVS